MGFGTITGALASTATKFGGDVMNLVQQWLSGINIAAVDSTNKPQIDTDTRIRSKRLRFQDASTPTRREVDWEVANQSADRTIQVPALSNATQKLVLELESLRLKNKIFDGADNNTFANIPQASITGLSGVLTAATHVGTGAGKIAKSSTGGILTLKSVLAGSNVQVINGTDDITVSANPASIGGFLPLVADLPSQSNTGLTYLSLAGGNSNATLTNRTIEIGMDLIVTSVRARVQTNTSNGNLEFGIVDDGVIVAKVTLTAGQTGYFENDLSTPITIAAGSQVAISVNQLGTSGTYEARPICINVTTGPAGGITAFSNVGSGTGTIFRNLTGVTANLKTLLAGSGITLTNNADDITITASSIGAHKANHVAGGSDAFVKGDALNVASRYLSAVADPTSDSSRFWINSPGLDIKYWDTQASPVKQTLERQSNKNAASGYAPLDSNARLPLTNLNQITDKLKMHPKTMYDFSDTRYGAYIGTTINGATGIWDGVISSTGNWNHHSSTSTQYRPRFTTGTTSGNQAGIRTSILFIKPQHGNPYLLRGKIELLNTITQAFFFVGLTSGHTGAFPTATQGVGTWGTGISVIGISAEPVASAVNFKAYRNDGTTTGTIVDLSPTTSTSAGGNHEFYITCDESTTTWNINFDGTDNTFNTDVPVLNTGLGMLCYLETRDTNAKEMHISYLDTVGEKR